MIVLNVLRSLQMLTLAVQHLRTRCVIGIEANEARCAELLSGSLAYAAQLVNQVGYDRAAAIAKRALESERMLFETLREMEGISVEQARGLLDEPPDRDVLDIP